MRIFEDPVHQQFAEWALGFAPFGGSDVGELDAIAAAVAPGNDDSFHDAYSSFAKRRIAEGEAALAKGHHASARACFLRAAQYLSNATHPLFGTPVDPRVVAGYRLMMATFERALALSEAPVVKLDLPYEGTTLPGYFLRARGHEHAPRPTIIAGGGWDSCMVDNYFGIGVAALERGYHVILHDGPGQGGALIERGLTLRHDWEQVVTPVVDVAMALDGVDASRIVYQPWSLGGYMAPRVAAFEHRLAAVVCDPGQMDIGRKMNAALGKLGLSPEAIARLPRMTPNDEQRLMGVIEGSRTLRWQIAGRAFWANGARDLPSLAAELMKWSLDPATVAQVRCPALVTAADGDRASTDSRELYDALRCPKTFVQFTEADGAAQHCAILNRTFAERVILDWLDATLGMQA